MQTLHFLLSLVNLAVSIVAVALAIVFYFVKGTRPETSGSWRFLLVAAAVFAAAEVAGIARELTTAPGLGPVFASEWYPLLPELIELVFVSSFAAGFFQLYVVEQQRREKLGNLQIVREEVLSTEDESSILDQAMHAFTAVLGFDVAVLFRVDGERGLVESAGTAGRCRGTPEQSLSADTLQLVAVIAQAGERTVVDTHKGPASSKMQGARPKGTLRVFAPLITEGAVIAVIGAGYSKRHRGPLKGEDLRVLQSFVDQVGAACENARLRQGMATRLRNLETLQSAKRKVDTELSLLPFLRLVLNEGIRLVRAKSGSLMLLDRKTRELKPAAWVGEGRTDQLNQLRGFRIGEGIAGWVALHERPHRTGDAANETQFRQAIDGAIVSLLSVPIISHLGLIGVMNVDSAEGEYFDSESEILLSTLADSVAIAIERVRLLDTRSREVELLNSIGEIISTRSISSAEHLLELIYHETKRSGLVDTANCYVALRDEDTNLVSFPFVVRNGARVDRTARPCEGGEGLTEYVLQTREPLLIRENVEHWREEHNIGPFEGRCPKSWLAVPMFVAENPVGVTGMYNYDAEGMYDESDARVLSTIASQTAIAIDRFRLFDSQNRQVLELAHAYRALDQAQKRRIAAETWAALGKAATVLAHRMNNLGGIIPVRVQQLMPLIGESSVASKHLDTISRNARYIMELAESLLRPLGPHDIELLDLYQMLEQALSVVEVPSRIRVVKQYRDDLPSVRISGLIVDVFVELIGNAVAAIPDEGSITITAVAEGLGVNVWVEDSGMGIHPDKHDRVFQFFGLVRERGAGKRGFGLGLWWVKTYLLSQGADITLEKSKPGEGTIFMIELPVRAEGPESEYRKTSDSHH